MGLVSPVDHINVASEYPNVFKGLGKLSTKHVLRLKDNVKPVIQSPRRVPFRLRNKLRDTLKSMENSGTIVKVTTPTEWVHPIVNVLKPDGSLRVCLDPTELNKCIKRENYALPTATEIFASISKSKVFTTLDATSGFLQLELDEESSFLTTFATPFGRYRFLRLPFGISSAAEVFQRTVADLFRDVSGVETYIDDILIHAPDKETHDKILRQVLGICQSAGLTLNQTKCKFEQKELKYLGHIIGDGKIKADPEKIRAIEGMPDPKSPEDVKRLLGMVTYLAKFCPNLSEVTTPLRDLTKKGMKEWVWDQTHRDALRKLKHILASNSVLKAYDPNAPIVISVDSSKNGMGAVILQNGQPVEYASCTLTDTQKAYAQIEKEFLAVQFGLKRFHQYAYGQPVVVETDHLPLLAIMKKNLGDLTPRLLRMRLRMQYYDFTLIHKPGSQLYIADALSRAFLDNFCDSHNEFLDRDRDQLHAVVTGILPQKLFREKFRQATCSDPSLNVLKSYIEGGWPRNKRACIQPLRAFWKIRNELSTHEDLILRNSQIVVPLSLRRLMLQEIHKGHLGITKCHERAKNTVYWPGYQGQITDMIEGCSACQENMRANDKTMLEPFEVPSYPMQTISMDVFHYDGKEYLVTIDRYSKWPSCYDFSNQHRRI